MIDKNQDESNISTEEDLMFLRFIREGRQSEFSDEGVIEELEEMIFESESKHDEQLDRFEEENMKVFVKSLYNYL